MSILEANESRKMLGNQHKNLSYMDFRETKPLEDVPEVRKKLLISSFYENQYKLILFAS